MPDANQHSGRLGQIENRVAWCEAWDGRPGVSKPQITQEWRNLLIDVRWLIEQKGALEREAKLARTYWYGVFEAGIAEELGALIVAFDDLADEELDRVLEAAQMVDSEAQDLFERRNAASFPASEPDVSERGTHESPSSPKGKTAMGQLASPRSETSDQKEEA